MSTKTPNPPNAEFFERAIGNTLALPCVADNALVLDDESLLPALQAKWSPAHPYKTIGGGSNLVLPERLLGRVVLMALKGIRLIEEDEASVLVSVAAGQSWHGWVETALAAGWHGLENLALIPGSVGAAPVQNIGAYGVEVSQCITHVRVWDFEQGHVRNLSAAECRFAYRDSLFKQTEGRSLLILSVCFRLTKRQAWRAVLDYPDLRSLTLGEADTEVEVTPQMVFDQVVAVRRHKLPDPSDIPNVGSFFKNPVVCSTTFQTLKQRHPQLVAYPQANDQYKLAAGWLIDQCGWKGKRMGAVGVHERQALVLVNISAGRAADVLALADAIRTDVFKTFGVGLEIEPNCWV
ncbi:MAG: UDP-N-acetylmuramate dehydrogenase [Orrella sp.]